MKLMHYAAEALDFDRSRQYEQDEPHGHGKPVGFWVSVFGEDDWPSWCRNEECFIESLRFAYLTTLSENANILRITSGQELDHFHTAWSVRSDFDRHYHYDDPKWWPINWPMVASKNDGVIIAPYLWQRRLGEPSWYYTWDCASGCIWNLNAIESVDLVTVSEVSVS